MFLFLFCDFQIDLAKLFETSALQYGFGRHLWDTPAIWLPPLLKVNFHLTALTIIYV